MRSWHDSVLDLFNVEAKAITMMRVYDFDGHQVGAWQFTPVLFDGARLVDWNERRSLFLTEAGDIKMRDRPMEIVEAVAK